VGGQRGYPYLYGHLLGAVAHWLAVEGVIDMGPDIFFVVGRILHVIGVVLWIGGVAFIATILLPVLRGMTEPAKSLALFSAIEGRFKTQAKIVTLITGLSGFFMLNWIDGWERYRDPSFWWLDLMTFIWFLFTLILFVVEPLLLKRGVHTAAIRDPARAMRVANRMLLILTALSLIAILGAILGVHG